MNTEPRKTTFSVDGHPDENQLLLALERELPPEEAAEIEQHLGNCWSCRARSSEMQSGILAFVEYREQRYLPSLEPPPHDFGGFPGKLLKTAAEGTPDVLALRIWRPGTLAEVVAVAEWTDGVRLGELLAALQPDSQAAEQALAEILRAAVGHAGG